MFPAVVSPAPGALLAQRTAAPPPGGASAEGANPYRGQPQALEEGERIYRSRCYGCHFRGGGRGPNLFRTPLTDPQFLDAVLRGRPNGMPAWGGVLSTDEIWKVHAFILSRDRL